MSADIISDVRAFLAFQGELGWRGTSVALGAIETPVVASAQTSAVCTDCKLIGAGDPKARLMFIAEADRQGGEPLTSDDRALLAKMIEAMGFKPAQVYIASLTRCGAPREACLAFLRQHVSAVKPSVIVAMGEPAAQLFVRDNAPIAQLRGAWRDYEGIPVMPTYHPALLSRSPAEKRPVWNDLKSVMARLAL